ncbi:ligand-binding sensor domain-containing protein [Spirosoma aerophilum]
MKYIPVYALLLMAVFYTASKGQGKADISKERTKSENNEVITSYGPKAITRNIIQDRKGNMWIAAFDGIFRYDGKSFTNITSNVSSARFFSLLEDRKGTLWFGSIGSGVFRYDGHSFQHFTIKDGLLNNDVGSIYEDEKGDIWFGVFGGASRYDGKSFRNYIINGDSMDEDRTGETFSQRPPYEVNSIIEDKTGKLWFATRSHTFVYDGHTFTVFRKKDGKPFTNVRTIIEDRKGAIWLAGNDGLWRYDGRSFANFIVAFAGYVYEDKKGNIWTSSDSDNKSNFSVGLQGVSGQKGWLLSRFNAHSLSTNTGVPTIIRANEGMLFGIREANDGSIWFGSLNGVSRYDGKTITDFNSKKN